MPDPELVSLLHDIVDHLTARTGWRSFWRRRARRARLVERLHGAIVLHGKPGRLPELVEQTRKAWAGDARVRVAPNAVISADRESLWVSAWLLVAETPGPVDPDRLAVALAGLSPLRREIFRLHRIEGLDQATIASRLGMSVETARHELASALLALGEVMHGHRP